MQRNGSEKRNTTVHSMKRVREHEKMFSELKNKTRELDTLSQFSN